MLEENKREDNIQEPEPEDFLPAPRKKGYLQRIPSVSSINPALFMLILCGVVSQLYWNSEYKDLLWASRHSIFEKKEYWRLITALFTHSDLMHLMNNSFLFFVFGSLLRFYYGLRVFPFASLAVGAVTTLSSAYFHEANVHLVGASGMIYGMVAMWLVLYVKFDSLYSLPMRIFRASGFSLVMLMPSTFQVQVDYTAHSLGFAFGIVAGLLLIPSVSKTVREFYRRNPDYTP